MRTTMIGKADIDIGAWYPVLRFSLWHEMFEFLVQSWAIGQVGCYNLTNVIVTLAVTANIGSTPATSQLQGQCGLDLAVFYLFLYLFLLPLRLLVLLNVTGLGSRLVENHKLLCDESLDMVVIHFAPM